MDCRHCGTSLTHTFIDLGFAPPSNAYLTHEQLNQPELYFPLKVKVCHQCWLVQTEDYSQAEELFDANYAYFSSTSSGWLAHAKAYSESIIEHLTLDSNSFVIEIASNDGYLLKNFVAAGIPCLGVEPTASTAAAAEQIGIPVLKAFFSEKLAAELATKQQADLIVGNNVYAHVPDINDFTKGLKTALKPNGTITLEFPHLLQLIEQVQFDTIYHEHFSYLSLNTVTKIFTAAGLRIWDVETLPTHGGSLRIYGCHADDTRPNKPAVNAMLESEKDYGLQDLDVYLQFQERANKLKNELLGFLLQQKQLGKTVAAYGAAAKGNTMLNFAGVKPDLLPCVYDAASSKQGKFMPGSHIPILAPQYLADQAPDFLVILPWNIAAEVKNHHKNLVAKGTQFVTFVPQLSIES
ncbi:class I SAM-dependent methyltransferase [Shewanella aestuarii]|uniref:Class I SAM-dependent methyltransferase n=1 Tax=Shewanella aestuarii TaxID=1028752 RepID=A0A6G9QJ85_9GAMM|nr:class I SAM-dependent methyltransferase [Shewanella aestuarii]QIR13941.1 class I SAM-dependent methyltransferase [Shewanella aestuarii]